MKILKLYRVFFLSIFLINIYGLGLQKIQSADEIKNETAPVSIDYSIDGQGFLKVNGQKTFPFGMFHLNDWTGSYENDLTTELQKMINDDFTVVGTTMNNELSDVAYDFSAQNNLPNIGSYDPNRFVDVNGKQVPVQVYNMRNHDAIVGWNILDDFNYKPGDPYVTPAEATDKISKIKEIDPDTFSFASGSAYPDIDQDSHHPLSEYAGKIDIIGLENYPITTTQEPPYETAMEESINSYRYARNQLPNQALWAEPQLFWWKDWWWNTGRWPYDYEVRNMVMGAYVAGMNGVLGFTYSGTKPPLDQSRPELYLEMSKLGADTKAIDHFLLYGNRTTWDAISDTQAITGSNWGKAHLQAGIWEYNGEVLVIVINTLKSSTEANIPLPASAGSNPNVAAVFGNDTRYGNNLTYSSGHLTGTVGSEAVHIYKITSNAEPIACFADFDKNLKVDANDFAIFASNYKQSGIDCSLDLIGGDCYLNTGDFGEFASAYKQPCI